MPNTKIRHKAEMLRGKLENTYHKLGRKNRLNPLLFSMGLLAAFLSLFLVIENFFYLSPIVKSISIFGILVASVMVIIRQRKKREFADFKSYYRAFGKYANLKELNYAIDLMDNAPVASPALIKAAIDDNLAKVDEQKFDLKLAEFVENRKTSKIFLHNVAISSVSVLAILVLAIMLPDGSQRLSQFWKKFIPPNPYHYTILPGNSTFEQGSPFEVRTIFNSNNTPKELVLRVKTSVENEFRSINMAVSDSGYRSIPFNINNDMEYYVEMDKFKSEKYSASVQLRPRFTHLEAISIPPAYTKLDTTIKNYPFSQIEAIKGTELQINGTLNKPVDKIEVIIGNERITPEQNDSLSYTFALDIIQKDTLSFDLVDKNGLTNKNSFRFVLSPIDDAYPQVEIVEPAYSLEMMKPKNLDIIYKATDDFGLTSARLYYEFRKAFVDKPQKGTIPLNQPINGALQQYQWDLKELNLTPLDEVDFYIQVSDNDGYNGYKTAQSQVITLTVPSLIDYFDGISEDEADIESTFEDITRSFEEMEQKYEEFKKNLIENPERDYEQHKQLEEVSEQQKEIEKQIDELNKKFEEIKQELGENEMLSDETRKAYDELKQLMEEINDPAIQEALQKLQEQMSQMTPEQLRKALEEVEFNEEAYKERLQRTINLFKQLKLLSDMEKLAESFENKARQEEEIKEDNPGEDEFSRKRQQDKQQMEKLKDALEKLGDYTSEKNQSLIDEYRQETQQDLDDLRQQIEDQLEKMSGEGGDNPQNGQQETFEQQFQEMADRTRSAMKGASSQQLNVNIAALRSVLYNLLTISNEQEDLVVSVQGIDNNSIAFVDYARNQKNIQQIFKVISDSLSGLASEIPQFSNEINKKKLEVRKYIENTIEQMSDRNMRNSSVSSRQAYGGINEIAFNLTNLLEQLQEQGDGSGGGGMSLEQMMEQLGEMGKNQEQLNQQIQDMVNDIQGERLNQNQMERIEQMARQQNEIRKQLEELQKNGGTDGDKIGSELQRIIEEMEDIINDMRGGAVDRTLINRQQNILSRMLESEKSLQERGEEEKREGKSGEAPERIIPPELTLEELEKQIKARLNDPEYTKYAPDYRKLIERYFELLYEIEKQNIP